MEETVDYLSLFQKISHWSPEILQSGFYHLHQEKSCTSLWLIMPLYTKNNKAVEASKRRQVFEKEKEKVIENLTVND